MTIFSYIIEHDLGFAPNPFHGFCTLACCKPIFRKLAEIGDYVLGTGAVEPKLRGYITYWMRVDEILTFDEYWADPRFRRKKPMMSGTTYLRYGDNIYHRDGTGVLRQENSFHSREDGSLSPGDFERDTGRTEKVLISHEFAYWGRAAKALPPDLQCFVRRQKWHFTDVQIERFMAWLAEHPERGYRGEPAHWQFLEKRKSKKAKR